MCLVERIHAQPNFENKPDLSKACQVFVGTLDDALVTLESSIDAMPLTIDEHHHHRGDRKNVNSHHHLHHHDDDVVVGSWECTPAPCAGSNDDNSARIPSR